MSIIETANLSKSYEFKGGTIPVLRDINFSVKKGEFIGVIGPSGSGKTTLMAILGGLLNLTNGSIRINGDQLEELSNDRLAEFRLNNLGFIFQSNHLIPTLTAIENVEVPLLLAKIPLENRRKIAMTMIKEVGLEKKINNLPDKLSGGEKQRVGVARALVNNPSIILADEPTGNLDSLTGGQIIHLLKEISKKDGTTILVVSHDPTHFSEFDRILKLEKGGLVSVKSDAKT
jgi:putative ABC transport system ATP-binding protein